MKVIKSAEALASEIAFERKLSRSIGFTPTMGALHSGHLSLVEASKRENDISVVSIFVNPKQFGESKDLTTYPKPIEKDMDMLITAGVDYLFLPDYEDVYPNNIDFPEIPLGAIETTLEGESRPGHFQGVALVVKRFFDIITPSNAYFGQKDFQQTVVVGMLIEHFNLKTTLRVCAIAREKNGLAMSSRNIRLNPQDQSKAGFLYQSLVKLKESTHHVALKEAVSKTRKYLESMPTVKVEYLAAINGNTMEEVESLDDASYIAVVTVVQFGGIRMLDNLIIKKPE
jgi:pantoate--beta-alanine ligase